jgi:zinc transport system ATP-binding protein
MSKQIVTLNNIDFNYGSRPILKGINFHLDPLDYVSIIGPNGGGKTTIIKLILGLLSPSSGEISVFDASPKEGRKDIGYLAQYHHFDLNYPISVLELVQMGTLGKSIFQRFTKEDRAAALDALKKTQCEALCDRHFSELSGGEKQRVLLARAIIRDPKLLILDEPTTGVDQHSEHCFYELLEVLNKEMAILMVSHDISAVSQYVKKVACLNQTMVYHGTKELMPKDVENAYCCHVDMIAHGVPHRHLKEHKHD